MLGCMRRTCMQNEMHMMTWQNATRKQMTWQRGAPLAGLFLVVRGWKGFGWVIGPLWRGVGLHKRRGFWATRLTVGVSNGLQMARNLTGGLPVVYQGHLARLGPFRESLTPAHNERQKGMSEDIGVSNCKTDNGENARMHEKNTYAK